MKLNLYIHSKTGKNYNVLCLGEHSETHEKMVVYQQYPQDGVNSPIIWIRPLNMFNEEIELNGKKVKRFEKLIEE